ncbi:acyl-CoA N-acyltransferase [Syncephalis plumigaleata]|nr:acyl-CoA N-acyltransferase [Syncephalis plumigaleata]
MPSSSAPSTVVVSDNTIPVNNTVRIRLSTSEDVVHVDRLHEIINGAYRGEKSWTTEMHLVKEERITKSALIERLTASSPATLIAELVSTDPSDNTPPYVVGTVEVAISDAVGEVSAEGDDEPQYKIDDTTCSYGLIGLLAVDPNHQSRHIGSSLMRAAEEHARDQLNLSQVGCWVIKQRADIIKWYQRMGFKDTGRELPFVWEHLLIDKTARFRIFLKEVESTN